MIAGVVVIPRGSRRLQFSLEMTDNADGSTSVAVHVDGTEARSLVRVADAARQLLEPDLPPDIEKYEHAAAVQRIRRAVIKGVIRKVGPLIVRSDFRAWHAGRVPR